MPFNPDEYLATKTGFNPDAYIASKNQIPPEKTMPPNPVPDEGAGAAGLQGFGQGGTLGYLPQLQAGFGYGVEKLSELAGGGPATPYEDLKKYFQTRGENLQEQHPLATAAGNVAGAAATLPLIPGGAAVKGAGTIAKLGKAALAGAAYGGLSNPNVESTEQDPYANLKARLNNAAIGGVTGAAGEGLISGIGGLVKTGEKYAEKAVVKQIGANAGQIKRILKKDELPKIEGFLTQEKLISPGTSLENVADRSKEILAEDGPKIGALYDEVASTGMADISGRDLAAQILKEAKNATRANANQAQVLSEIKSAIKPLKKMGDNVNIVDLHNYRKSLDENIDWTQATKERGAVQKAYVDARNTVADKIKSTIERLDQMLGGEQLKVLKALNERYSAASTVNNIATQGVARETAKAFMGHGVIGAGAGVGAAGIEYRRTHDPLQALGAGILGAAAVTGARKFGTPLGYYGGKALSQLAKPARAASNNPALGAAYASPWVMMNQGAK